MVKRSTVNWKLRLVSRRVATSLERATVSMRLRARAASVWASSITDRTKLVEWMTTSMSPGVGRRKGRRSWSSGEAEGRTP